MSPSRPPHLLHRARPQGYRDPLVRIALLVTLAVAVLFPAGIWLQRALAERLIEARIGDMQRSLASQTARTMRRITLAENLVGRLASRLSVAAGELDAHDAQRFEASTSRAPDGTLRWARRSSPVRAMLWVPAGVSLDLFWKEMLVRTTDILSDVGSGAVSESADDLWFMSAHGAELMYSPRDSAYVDRPTPASYSPEFWLAPVRREQDPTGAPRWLDAQPSPIPPRWYGSVVAPVWRDSVLLGATGIDLALPPLLRQTSWLPVSAGNAQLVIEHRRGNLVIDGTGAGLERSARDSIAVGDLPSPLRDSLSLIVLRAASVPAQRVLRGAVGDRVMLAIRLPRPDWTIITLIDRAAIVAPLQGPLRLMRFALATIVGLMLLAVLGIATSDVRRYQAVDEARVRGSVRFNRLFQMLPVAVTLTRADRHTLVEANEVARRMLDIPADDPLDHHVTDTGLWPSPDERDAVLRQVQSEGSVTDRAGAIQRPDGTSVETRTSVRMIEVDDEPHLLTVVQDVSTERRLEAKRAQAQRLESVGRLAGGVAHDFNNLLTAVIGYAQQIRHSLPPDDPRHHDVEEILVAAKRGATLTRQLLGFARRQPSQPREVDVNQVVRGLRGMFRSLIGEDVQVITALDDGIGSVMIDPGQLEQVITNLAINARDAMPDGGVLTIRTHDDGTTVSLEVADNGCGIDDEVLTHIFDPFFTTKSFGGGTGLGLATSYGIVQQAGGTIRVESSVGKGSTFHVELPRHGDPSKGANRAKNRVRAPMGHPTQHILIVEDDDSVRRTVLAMVQQAGFSAVAVDGASKALAHLLEAPKETDLVICDVVMPHLSGPAFAHVLATTHPGLRVLFMSGYAPDGEMRRTLATLGHPFVAKPFTGEELTDAIATALSRS